MNYFIMQLKIPLYGTEMFYFYDVLEALARDVFQRTINEQREELIEELIEKEIWVKENDDSSIQI